MEIDYKVKKEEINLFFNFIKNIGFQFLKVDNKKILNKYKFIIFKKHHFKYKEEEIIIAEGHNLNGQVMWYLKWSDYEGFLFSNTIPNYIKIFKSKFPAETRKLKINKILND